MNYPFAHGYWEMINNGYPLRPMYNSDEDKILSGDISMNVSPEGIWINRCNRLCLRLRRMPTPREIFEQTLKDNKKPLSLLEGISFDDYQKRMTTHFLRQYWEGHDYEVTEEEILRRMEPYYREHPYERPEGGQDVNK